MPKDEEAPATSDEPTVEEHEDDDVEGHSFQSRTRADESAGSGRAISGGTGPDIDVRS